MASYGGWTGKTLRVNLSTGQITTEDTVEKYMDYLGGTGVAYKVLWDEVPAGTKAYDEANKIIFGVGPLTGTGAPCGGRISVTAISPVSYPMHLVASGHMGGHWGAELKFAGWDNVIVEGKADKPVYIAIMDDKVEIRDASQLWGNGIYRATAQITEAMGAGAMVAAIGQAGENLVPLSVVMNSNSHSAGAGMGAVMGSKKLKAIGVIGTGSVKIAADKADWKEANRYMLSLLGANNNHVVPNSPQPWAEFYAATRWTARKGLFWGAADPPVETGTCDPHDLNSIGYRTMKATFDMGPLAERYTVRMGGCHSCPIRCHIHLDVPSVEAKYGVSRYAANTCAGWGGKNVFKSFPDGPQGLTSIEANVLGKHLADDYGTWDNYGLLQRTFQFAYDKGYIKANLPKAEYDSIPWSKFEKGDPEFLFDFFKRIAFKQGEFGTAMGLDGARLAERWKFGPEYEDDHDVVYWKMGHPKHHSSEDGGQVGSLQQLIYNRDAQIHSSTNFIRNGLPIKVQKAVFEKVFGPGWGAAVDQVNNYTPMNEYKAKWAKFGLLRKELHDSLTLCNWMGPWYASPLKERDYTGDLGLEARFYSLATGDQKSMEELDTVAERIFNLHRALTIRDMGTKEMRVKHDTIPPWVFDYPADKAPFTPGHYKMDKADMEKAKDLFYMELGWDGATGSPSRYTYERLGLKDVADGLDKVGLL
ncbi:MAG TPA: aldehyde ferredoxin oxidoreductase [Chloroflexota bacterium]